MMEHFPGFTSEMQNWQGKRFDVYPGPSAQL